MFDYDRIDAALRTRTAAKFFGQPLDLDTLLPPGQAGPLPRRGLPLPSEGGRVTLVAGKRHVGWLDVWGNGGPARLEARRALSGVARVMAALLADAERGR